MFVAPIATQPVTQVLICVAAAGVVGALNNVLMTSDFEQQVGIEDYSFSWLYSPARGKTVFIGGSRLADLSLSSVSDSHPLIKTGQIQMAHLFYSYRKSFQYNSHD